MKKRNKTAPEQQPEQEPMPEIGTEIPGPPKEQLVQEMHDATRPIPGFEDTDLRYAGNEQMGYFPCIASGTCIVTMDGAPVRWPTKAHLRLWARNFLEAQARQASGIVVPRGTLKN